MICLKKIIFSISIFFACLGLILLVQDTPLEVYVSTVDTCNQVFGSKEYTRELIMCSADAAEYETKTREQFYLYIIIGGVVAIMTGIGLEKDKKKCVNRKE